MNDWPPGYDPSLDPEERELGYLRTLEVLAAERDELKQRVEELEWALEHTEQAHLTAREDADRLAEAVEEFLRLGYLPPATGRSNLEKALAAHRKAKEE